MAGGKRRNMKYGKSKKLFSRTAGLNGMHRKNAMNRYNMRGGVRL